MKNNEINVFYAANERYAIPTCVSIASILKNSNESDKIHIFVYDFGLSENSKCAIERLKEQIRDFKLNFMQFDEDILRTFNVGPKWHHSIRLKLFIDKLFPNLERVIWMNGNTLVRGNIRDFYDIDLQDKYFGLVSWALNDSKQNETICDCMLVCNIPVAIRDNIFQRLIHDVKILEHKEKAYAGEIALRNISADKKFIFPVDFFASVDISKREKRYVSPTASVVKFSERNNFAPWLVGKRDYPKVAIDSYDEWHAYCALTDYKSLENTLCNRSLSFFEKFRHKIFR